MAPKNYYVFVKINGKWRYDKYDPEDDVSFEPYQHFFVEQIVGGMNSNYYLKGTARHIATRWVLDNVDVTFEALMTDSFCDALYKDWKAVCDSQKS